MNMKWVSVLLLIVLAFTVLAPLSSFSFVIVEKGHNLIGNLDVCNSAAPGLSSNGEMPCVSVCPCSTVPPVSISASESVPQRFIALIFTAPNEHPPKA